MNVRSLKPDQERAARDQYIHELNQLFERHGLDLEVTVSDLTFLSEVVMDALKDKRHISSSLTKAISPPIHHGEFYHYTCGDAADKIFDSGVLRLTTVRKRIADGEIRSFLYRFGFDYPLKTATGESNPRFHESIASQVFYASFTDTSLTPSEEKYFWHNFAKKDGARLKFALSLKSGCLRRVVYGNGVDRWANMFKEISDLTKRSLGKVFFWVDAATVCALLLPEQFGVEKETRLITRRGCGLSIGTEGNYEYLKANIGENAAIGLKMELKEIQTNRSVPNHRDVNLIPRIIEA